MKIIKFYADWCVPCKRYTPIIEEFCNDKGIELISVNIESNSDLTTKYQITSIPTTILIKEEGNEMKLMGVLSYDMLESYL